MRFRLSQLLAVTTLAAACMAMGRFADASKVNESSTFLIFVLLLPALAYGPLFVRDMIAARRRRQKDD
jgi:hypothetical protein